MSNLENLVATSIEAVSRMPDEGCMGVHGTASYLGWMIETVRTETGWPTDKRLRWLGFVMGAVDSAEGVGNSAPRRRELVLTHRNDMRADPQPVREKILFAAMSEVAFGLQEITEDGSGLRWLAYEVNQASNSGEAAFLLGYCQAFMTAAHVIGVEGERERTRPIFRRAYKECGFEIPESKSRQ